MIAFPTKTSALSRVCLCGRWAKKSLALPWHECPCGVSVQRDLYSAGSPAPPRQGTEWVAVRRP